MFFRLHEKNIEHILKGVYKIFTVAYTTLIADLRLSMCTLFVEDALDIDKAISEPETDRQNMTESDNHQETQSMIINHSSFEDYQRFTRNIKVLGGWGFIIGLFIFYAQILNALVYVKDKLIGPNANVVLCLSVWSFIIFGGILLKKVHVVF